MEEFKVRIIGDDADLKAKVAASRSQLNDFKKQAERDGKVKIQIEISTLQADLDKARKALRDFKKEGNKEGEIVARINIQNLQKSISSAQGSLTALTKTTEGTTGGFLNLNKITTDTIKVLGGFAIIRSVVTLFTDLFNAATSFESAFAGIKKTVNATASEFQVLETQFRDLAKAVPLPVEELLKIGELGGQLGVAKDKLADFTATIAKLSISTNLTSEDAATAFARIANVMQTPIEQTENLGSAIVAVGNNFATTEREVVDFTTRIAGAGKIAGFTSADLVGISTAFTSVGIEAEAGGTAVQKTILTINDAVANGGKELQKFASFTGKSAKDFAAQWRTAPVIAFQEFISSLANSGDQASAILGELVGDDVRLQRAFLSVAGAGDLMSRAVTTSNTAFVANSALTNEANRRFETTASKIQAIKNEFNDLAIDFGRQLQPVVLSTLTFFRDLANDVVKGTDRLKGFVTNMKILGEVLIAAFAGFKIKGFVDALTQGITKLVAAQNGISLVEAATVSFTGKIKALGLAFASNPIGLFTTALAGLTFLVVDGIRQVGEYNAALLNLKTTFDTLSQSSIGDSIGTSVTNAIVQLKELNTEIGVLEFSGTKGALGVASLNDKLTEQKDLITSTVDDLVRLGESYGLTGDQVELLIQKQELFKDGISPTTEQINLFTKALSEELSTALNSTADKFTSTFDTFSKDSKNSGEAFKKTVAAFKDDFKDFRDNGDSLTKELLDILIQRSGKTGDVGKAFTLGLTNGLTSNDVVSELEKGGVKITDDIIATLLRQAVDAKDVGNTYGLLLQLGISEKEADVIVASSNLADSVTAALQNRAPAVFNAALIFGANMVQSFANGIYNALPQLENAVNSVANIAGSLFPGVKAIGSAIGGVLGKQKALAAFSTPKLGGGGGSFKPTKSGGGGGSKKQSEAEKEAAERAKEAIKDAEDNVGELGDALDEINKKSAKLRDRIKEFFQSIVDSIKDAKGNIKSLEEELANVRKESTEDFLRDLAKRNEELIAAKDKIEAELKSIEPVEIVSDESIAKLQQQLADAQTVLAKVRKDGDKSKEIQVRTQIAALQKAISDAKNSKENAGNSERDTTDANAELVKILKEQQDIQTIINGLSDENKKKAQEIFDIEKRRVGLSESQLLNEDFKNKLSEKEKEINLEIEKQKRIIAIQQQFLDIQAKNDEQGNIDKFKLAQLANKDFEANSAEIIQSLKDLGFKELSNEEALMVLKEAQQARGLQLEQKAIENQQAAILDTKQRYFAEAEKAHALSTDRMKEKTSELIRQIQVAQDEQIKLNSLRGETSALASGSVTNTRNLTVNQTVNSGADADAIVRNIISKVP